MLNNVNIVGRLTKDVSLLYTQTGKAVANFTVASTRPFKNAQGERESDFVNTVQFGKGAELTAQYMKKGSLVGVTGRIQTRNYENNEGKKVYVTEVVAEQVAFLESKGQSQQNQRQESDPFNGKGEPLDISSSDLPF